MAIRNINNEVANIVGLYGTEAVPGVAVEPTARLNGEFSSTSRRGPIRRREEATGGYDRLRNFSRERTDPSGTYGTDLSYEELAALLRYSVAGGGTGTELAVGAYQHRKVPNFRADDVDTMTVVSGIEGKGYQSTGVRFDQFTIAIDATDTDNVWKWSSDLFLKDRDRLPGHWTGPITAGTEGELTVAGESWEIDQWEGAFVTVDYGTHIGPVRMIESNTADALTLETPLDAAPDTGAIIHIAAPLPTVAETSHEFIPVEGTRLMIGPWNDADPFGEMYDVSERMLSANVTQEMNLSGKDRWVGRIGRVSRGARWISGTIRLEDDYWDEDKVWENDEAISIQIMQDGPEIDSTGEFYHAQIDLAKVGFSTITPDQDNNNMTKSIAFIAALPEGADIAGFESVIPLETLP